MAFANLTKTIKLIFLNNLVKLLAPHIHQPLKSFKPILKSEAVVFPEKNLLPATHRNMQMKDTNVYENLIKQNISQTKFCTKSKKDPDDEDPPGRHKFHKDTEESINEQIGAELNAAFSYLSMACYFGRTEVSLPGCQGFFMNMYEEELEHATVFINYQLLRGAHVALSDIDVPENQDWKSIKKAFSVALEMEKFVKEKLDCVFEIAEKHKDLEVMDIVSTQFMKEQNRSICELARLLKISQMSDDPVGEYLFDKLLYNSFVKKSKDNLMYKKELEDEPENKVYK